MTSDLAWTIDAMYEPMRFSKFEMPRVEQWKYLILTHIQLATERVQYYTDDGISLSGMVAVLKCSPSL